MSTNLEILYVEDCGATVELFKLALGRYARDIEVSIDVAATVSSAKNKFSPTRHKAALIDWNLPDGKGVDIAQYIRDRKPKFPIVFLSALFTGDLVKQAEVFSGSACIEKNFNKEFVESIRVHISLNQ